jgi:hypothetical protein
MSTDPESTAHPNQQCFPQTKEKEEPHTETESNPTHIHPK